MSDLTRREAFRAAALGAPALASGPTRTSAVSPTPHTRQAAADDRTDRERVIACGFMEAEADCWELVSEASGKPFELPRLHGMDDHEVAPAVRVIQHKLLARPAFRKYLALAKGEIPKSQ